jgi:predicted enzyme related to lactoylglutathione lyase
VTGISGITQADRAWWQQRAAAELGSVLHQNPDLACIGWTVGPGAGGYEGWITAGSQPWAGITPAGPAPAGRWIPYVVVEDLDAAAEQAVALGGRVVQAKTAGPAGTSVTVADPGGALVALFIPAGG